MVKTRLRWFEHLERRLADSVVRKVDQISRGRGRLRKTIREIVKINLENNELLR